MKGVWLKYGRRLTFLNCPECAIAQLQGLLARIEKGEKHRTGCFVGEDASFTVPMLSLAIILKLVQSSSSSLVSKRKKNGVSEGSFEIGERPHSQFRVPCQR